MVVLAILLLPVAGLATVLLWPDPVGDVRTELLAATNASSNHAPYASLVRQELAVRDRLKTCTFAMPCFWAGESHFGGIDGVYRTTPGTQGGKEVVRVDYDPAVTSAQELLLHPVDPAAVGRGCRYQPEETFLVANDAAFKEDDLPKWSIRQTDALKCVPMTPAQACRVNADFHAGRPVDRWLSPKQNAMVQKVRDNLKGGWREYIHDESLWRRLTTAVDRPTSR